MHQHELQQQPQQQLANVGAATNIVRRNIAAGKLVYY